MNESPRESFDQKYVSYVRSKSCDDWNIAVSDMKYIYILIYKQ